MGVMRLQSVIYYHTAPVIAPCRVAEDRLKIQAFLFEHPSRQAEGRDHLLFIAGVKHPNRSRESRFLVGKVGKVRLGLRIIRLLP
jgi:hypothetical protein